MCTRRGVGCIVARKVALIIVRYIIMSVAVGRSPCNTASLSSSPAVDSNASAEPDAPSSTACDGGISELVTSPPTGARDWSPLLSVCTSYIQGSALSPHLLHPQISQAYSQAQRIAAKHPTCPASALPNSAMPSPPSRLRPNGTARLSHPERRARTCRHPRLARKSRRITFI